MVPAPSWLVRLSWPPRRGVAKAPVDCPKVAIGLFPWNCCPPNDAMLMMEPPVRLAAMRRAAGSRVGPFGTAQLTSVPSISNRTS